MATTTNYGWTTPDDTDLVKDGAAAIRTLGSSVDTTTKALNPETTTGDIAYRSATANTNTRLALGTAGQVLTVNSGATAPEWAAPAAGGGMTSIASGSLSGASVTLSSIAGTYNNLFLVIRDYYVSGASGLQIILNTIANYTYAQNATNTVSSVGSQVYSDLGSGTIPTHNSNLSTSDTNNWAGIMLFDYANTVSRKCFQINSGYTNSSSVLQACNVWGFAEMTAAISSIKMQTSAGNFSGGTYILYGVK